MSVKQLKPLDDEALADLFWEWCEFAALEEPPPDWVELESKELLQVVGKDACGGRFCLFPATADYSGRLLYIDSEGRAGVIASSLTEGISMMLALPTWRDCLQFSDGGKLEEMKKAEMLSMRDFRSERPDVEANRMKLSKAFGVEPLPATIDTLHRVLSEGAAVKVVATIDRSVYEGLFGTFRPDDCRSWKDE